jgi:hypothetical protein
MRNQALMQTITRANRVFPGKNNGLIVGYVEILGNLRKALAIYATELGQTILPWRRRTRSSSSPRRVDEIHRFCQARRRPRPHTTAPVHGQA